MENLELATHTEIIIEGAEVICREASSMYDRGTPNSDLIRMTVKAFGWEVNRNGFMHKKKVLKRSAEDAFGEKTPLYRTFEGKLVDRNHAMKDSGSRIDEPIGYIENAYMKEDGVYFDMWIWKRCLSDDEQRQIRENEVSVSMEVDFDKPIVILDGEEFISTPENRAREGAVRSYADDATVNGLGIAVLFDGIKPGYASAAVIEHENAILDVTPDPAEDTVPHEVKRDIEAASAPALEETTDMQELETLKADLEKTNSELAAAKDELSAKSDEINKLYDELQALREKAFNDTVAAAFDLGKLEPITAGWLLDMLRWSSYDLEDTCNKLREVAQCIKPKGTKPSETASDEPAPEPAPAAEVPTEEPAPTPEPEKPGDEPAAAPENANAEEPVAPTTEEEPSAAPEIETAAAPVNIAEGHPTKFGSDAPKWGIEHL